MKTMKYLILLQLFFCTCHGVWDCGDKGESAPELRVQTGMIAKNGTETESRSLWNIGQRAPYCDRSCNNGMLCYHSLIRYTCEWASENGKGEYVTLYETRQLTGRTRTILVNAKVCFIIYGGPNDPKFRGFKAKNPNICFQFSQHRDCSTGYAGFGKGISQYDIQAVLILSHDAKANNCGKDNWGAPFSKN